MLPLRKDPNDNVLHGGSRIVGILNININSSTFTAIPLEPKLSCKSFYAKTRSGNNWLISTTAGGVAYATLGGALSMDLVATREETLFYAKSIDETDVMEVILLD